MRLIDADALAKAFREASETDDSKDNRTYWSEALISAAEEVDDAPTVDAVERKRGRWEMKPDPYGFFDEIPVCSECGCTTKMRETYKFCPNCGADMRGEANEHNN